MEYLNKINVGGKLATKTELISELRSRGITMESTISGYWRAMKDGDVYWDDSASEDAHDEISAICVVWSMEFDL